MDRYAKGGKQGPAVVINLIKMYVWCSSSHLETEQEHLWGIHRCSVTQLPVRCINHLTTWKSAFLPREIHTRVLASHVAGTSAAAGTFCNPLLDTHLSIFFDLVQISLTSIMETAGSEVPIFQVPFLNCMKVSLSVWTAYKQFQALAIRMLHWLGELCLIHFSISLITTWEPLQELHLHNNQIGDYAGCELLEGLEARKEGRSTMLLWWMHKWICLRQSSPCWLHQRIWLQCPGSLRRFCPWRTVCFCPNTSLFVTSVHPASWLNIQCRGGCSKFPVVASAEYLLPRLVLPLLHSAIEMIPYSTKCFPLQYMIWYRNNTPIFSQAVL